MPRALYIYFNQLCTSRRTKLLTEYRRGEEEHDQRPPDLEGARRVRLVVAQPEEADDDEEVDDLLRVAFDIENERIRDFRRRDQNDDQLPPRLSASNLSSINLRLKVRCIASGRQDDANMSQHVPNPPSPSQ